MRQLKITKSITNRENESLEKYLQEISPRGNDFSGGRGRIGTANP